MKLLILTVLALSFISCGKDNSTGPKSQVLYQETMKTSKEVNAILKLRALRGGVMSMHQLEMRADDLNRTLDLKEGLQSQSLSHNSSELVFYFKDIDERLKVEEIALNADELEIDLVLDRNDLQGKWGWIASNQAQTQYDEFSLRHSRVAIKNKEKIFIREVLENKKMIVLWNDSEIVVSGEETDSIIPKISELKLEREFDFDYRMDEIPRGIVKLAAYKQSYKKVISQKAMRHITYVEPEGRGTVARRVEETCHVKVSRLEIESAQAIEIAPILMFDTTTPRIENGWLHSKGETSAYIIGDHTPNLVSVGFESLGNCPQNARFVDRLPTRQQADSATRTLVKAKLYFAP